MVMQWGFCHNYEALLLNAWTSAIQPPMNGLSLSRAKANRITPLPGSDYHSFVIITINIMRSTTVQENATMALFGQNK